MSENLILDWTEDCFLKWSDFKAESNPAVYEDSHSVIKYRFTWTISSDIVDDKIMFLIDNVSVFVEFHPLLSWVRSELNEELLLHEQGCFDLAELVKRENFKKLEDLFYHQYYPTRGQNEEQRKQYAKEDSGKMIAIEVEKLQKLYYEQCKKYREDTNFGQNIDEQLKYNLVFKQLRL